MGKVNLQACAHCNITENAEHVLMHCVKCNEESVRLHQRVREDKQGWDLEGILGTSGDSEGNSERGSRILSKHHIV